MINGKDVIKITAILAISAFLLISPIIAVSSSFTETKSTELESISLVVMANTTKIINLPSEMLKIETSQNILKTQIKPKPENSLSTNNKDSIESSRLIYTHAYEHEVYKKGNEYELRIFVPENYYDSGKKITTKEIEFTIYYEEPQQTYESQGTQNPDYDYVIITNETLYPILNDNFVAWKISNDNKISSIYMVNVSDITANSSNWINSSYSDSIQAGNPFIPNGKQVTDHFSMFNDTQAQIRNFLRYYNDTHNTKYVLLAGNKDVIPPRIASSRASGTSCVSFDNDLAHASDLYYACLDYCMNNNTNSYWMENPCCGADWDEVDYGIDLHVGRVLVSNESQLMNWINKTKNYVLGENNSYKYQIVACKDGGYNIANQSWTGWNAGAFTGVELEDEFPVNMTFINGQNISQAQWVVMDDYVNGNIGNIGGINIIYHTGHGGSLNNVDGGCYNILSCNNINHPNFVYTEGCNSGDFEEGVNTRAENWIRHDGCAVAGVINSAFGWFVASTYFGEEMFSIMFNDTRGINNITFCEAHDQARELQGSTTSDGVWAMIFKETNFFGDPALDYKFYDTTWGTQGDSDISIIDISNQLNNSFIYTANPSFNWTIDVNASEYNLQIANDSAFADLVINITNINQWTYSTNCTQNATTVSFYLPNTNKLEFHNKYYVRVRSLIK